MRLIVGWRGVPSFPEGCAITIGNFDGVHLGHQAVLRSLIERADARRLPAVAVLFEPQPREFFDPDGAPPRLTRLREKLACLARHRLDYAILLRFDKQLAACTAERFVTELLVERLRIKHLLVGDDFRFGADRLGNFEFLAEAGRRYRFAVEDTATVTHTGARISSTGIRHALEQGNLDAAQAMLGRPFSLCGRVATGFRIGRSLGFPTANINLRRKSLPLQGVFAVTMATRETPDSRQSGVANVGFRPTVTAAVSAVLEVHLFDFDGDLYGRRVEVFFHRKLRAEQRFPGLAELQRQIAEDARTARQVLQSLNEFESTARGHGL